jgi:hypothetical protein
LTTVTTAKRSSVGSGETSPPSEDELSPEELRVLVQGIVVVVGARVVTGAAARVVLVPLAMVVAGVPALIVVALLDSTRGAVVVEDDVEVELDELVVELRAVASDAEVPLSSEQLLSTRVVVATKVSTR